MQGPGEEGANGAELAKVPQPDSRVQMPEFAADPKTMRAVAWTNLFTRIVDRFGVAFGLLLLCLVSIWWFGDDKTQNDFIREMLFGEITGTPTARLFFVGLIVLALVSSSTLVRRLTGEGREMKRIAADKARLQEKLIGRELSHTEDMRGP